MRKISLFCLVLILNAAALSAQTIDKIAVVEKGKQVSFEYTLTVDGKLVDSSEGQGPFQYTQGEGTIVPGLARQLEGLKVGDEKVIKVTPEEGYGAEDPKAFHEVPKQQLPQKFEPKVGALLTMKTKTGEEFPVKIAEVKKDSVIMNLNHPLAGKLLTFNIKIVSIK